MAEPGGAARGDAVPHTDADARPEYCAKAADSLSESGQVGHGAQSDPTTSLSSAAKLTLPADRVVPTTALTVRRGPLLPGSARLTALPTHRQRGLPLGSAAWSGNGRTCRVDVAGRSRLAPPTAVPLDGDDGALLGPFARIKQRDSLSLSSSDEDDARETTRRPARMGHERRPTPPPGGYEQQGVAVCGPPITQAPCLPTYHSVHRLVLLGDVRCV